jgi:hypothetical protein
MTFSIYYKYVNTVSISKAISSTKSNNNKVLGGPIACSPTIEQVLGAMLYDDCMEENIRDGTFDSVGLESITSRNDHDQGQGTNKELNKANQRGKQKSKSW